MEFHIEKKGPNLMRAGVIKTKHGEIKTPAFIPVGTKATVKALTNEQLDSIDTQAVLANTYHLYLEPGDELVKKAGGLHKFMNYDKPLMTDSGGFQVFSLGVALGYGISKILKPTSLVIPAKAGIQEDHGDLNLFKKARIDENGVMFRSHLDGSAHYFTPEKSMEIQHNLGADIIFAFDECTSPTESKSYQREALDRTHRWAKRSLKYHRKMEVKTRQSLELFKVDGTRICEKNLQRNLRRWNLMGMELAGVLKKKICPLQLNGQMRFCQKISRDIF